MDNQRSLAWDSPIAPTRSTSMSHYRTISSQRAFCITLYDDIPCRYAAKEAKLKEEEANEALDPGPKLDLAFKEGQTIKINIGNKSGGTSRPRPAASAGGPVPLLPPPPGSARSQ